MGPITKPHVGDIRATDYAEYGADRSGFIVERFGYHGNWTAPSWAVPAWDEQGSSELEGPFATKENAEAAIRDHMQFA